MTIKQFIEQLQDQGILVSVLLRRGKVLASKLEQNEILEWIDLELLGYRNDSTYPKYRKMSGQVKALDPYHGWQPVIFNNVEAEELVSNRENKQSIPEIEELIAAKGETFQMPFPDAVAAQILAKDSPRTKVTLMVERPVMVNALNGVRDALLDWALSLEKEGIHAESEDLDSSDKEKAQELEIEHNKEEGGASEREPTNIHVAGDKNIIAIGGHGGDGAVPGGGGGGGGAPGAGGGGGGGAGARGGDGGSLHIHEENQARQKSAWHETGLGKLVIGMVIVVLGGLALSFFV